MDQPGHKNVHLLSKPKPSLLENSQVPRDRCGMAGGLAEEYVFGDGCAVCDSGGMVCEDLVWHYLQGYPCQLGEKQKIQYR